MIVCFRYNQRLIVVQDVSSGKNNTGEALLKAGQKEEAIKMYQKSVELNPNNVNGKKILKEISN